MTSAPSILVAVGGVLAALSALLHLYGMRVLATGKAKGVPPIPVDPKTTRLFSRGTLLVPSMFAIIALLHSSELVSTSLGMTTLTGMCIYFALRAWAYAFSPDMQSAGPYVGTHIALGASGCFAIGAIANVI
jgi:hypothetical protein